VLRPLTLSAAGAVLLVLAFQLWITAGNPPGFHHDEAAFALNAYTIAHHLRDQDGALLPVVFPSFADYKDAAFSYVLAPAFLAFGPHQEVARAVAALFGLAAVVLVGLIGYRRGGVRVGIAAGCLAGLTPWLFQLGRVAYDTSTFPFVTALVLLAAELWSGSGRRAGLRGVFLGAALAATTYAYPAGRLLGPLLAVALVVFARRVPVRAFAWAWGTYAVLLVPLGLYRLHHPEGLTARYHQTSFVTPGMSKPTIVGRAVVHWLQDVDPWRWLVSGDRKPYVDVWGAPQLLAVTGLLAAIGVYVVLAERRGDRWWVYVVLATVLAGVPASLTADRHDALRLSALPVCFSVLAIPGLEAVARLRRPALQIAVAVLVAGTLAEWAFFVKTYSDDGRASRLVVFEAGVPALLRQGFAGGRTIYVDHDDAYGRTVAGWYAVSHGLPQSRVVRLPDGGIPPVGSTVFGRTQDCDYVCDRIASADSFWLARAAGPSSG
jgi:4-amino-4-deoxy-L-arabinose transferase-like glycosyltransferase